MPAPSIHRIGILGGTFNPVHHGHLLIARAALERFRLDRVLFVPCRVPPHKGGRDLAEARHRLAMLRRAVRGEPAFAVSSMELRRPGPSYSAETVMELRRRHPGARLYFIIGADSLLELHTWHRVEELLRQCVFVTAVRTGYRLAAGAIRLPAPWPRRLARRIFPGLALAVSSTDIRRRVAHGLPIRYLVPGGVEQYVRAHGLYQRKESSHRSDTNCRHRPQGAGG